MATSTDFKRRPGGAFQFRLRTMLLMVTLCGAACAVMHAIGPVWSAILCFMLLLAAMHVLGNAIGTRLRDDATANAATDARDRPNCPPAVLAPTHVKRLAQRAPLGRWIGVLSAVGLVAGGTLGGLLFSGQVTPAGAVVGTMSSAVLGGFAAFLAGSFLRVGFSALWQAHCDKPVAARAAAIRSSETTAA
jgi:hypothetical protein